MNQKQIGALLLILGLVIAVAVTLWKAKEDFYINSIIEVQNGSCYLDDGTCLHSDRSYAPYIVGYAAAAGLIILGLYLFLFDKTQMLIMKHNKDISEALDSSRKKDEFKAYLSGFTDDEQKILKTVSEQEGIPQNTLRLKTGMSKSTLSIMLQSLEKRQIISKKPSGKTNRIYLRKKF
jgi:DNA-binding MarR family transcriptional regulator